jgi:hypothetical protein
VCFDQPGPNEPEDIVAIGAVRRKLEIAAMIGSGAAGWLDEAYTVEIVVDVFRGSDTGQVAYARAMDLANAVVNIVRADITLGGHVVRSAPRGDTAEVEWDQDHGGKHACVTVEIECVTRI